MSSENFRDPLSFLPERWLPEGKEHFQTYQTAAFEPFGVGSRGCVSKNYALAEMRIVVARLLWNFDAGLAELVEGAEKFLSVGKSSATSEAHEG
jgi:cytochrome P450